MQQYFKTGKTIVIDDQYDEAKPLLEALCKINMPFSYTQGKPNADFPLPNSKPENASYYSLIFLDLNLDFKFAGGQIGTADEEKTFKSTHSKILDTIVKNKNRSFVLVIWSNEEENYKEHFLKIFELEETYKTSKKPYKIISLVKSDFFKQNENGNYQFTEGKEDELKERITTQLSDLNAFKLFCEWDGIVAQSVSDTIDDFMGLVNAVNEEDHREETLAKVITAISIAYSGDEGYLSLKTNEEKTDSVFLSLTQILTDDIDRNVLFRRQREFSQWKANSKEDIKKIKSIIGRNLLNRKLLIFLPNRKDLTGSLYKTILEKTVFEKIFLDSFVVSAISKDFIKQYKKDHAAFTTEFIEKAEKRYCLALVLKETIFVELNISPLCDIVQNKILDHRLIKGLLIPADYFDKIKGDYFYKTATFIFNNKDYFLGFDFRTFTSCPKKEIDAKEYLFTLRANLINDIQTKLAAHVSRLGVFNL